ncbi:MAG: sigma-54-dependent Fis family transcriptional regulator [bacterium]|nr:sigma-54-dependent Fis family transcriptional regulator [bacterium]
MPQDDAISRDPLQTETRSATARHPATRIRVPALTILCHPDPERVGERKVLTELLDGKTVELSRLEPAFAPIQRGVPRALGDPRLSRSPIRLEPAPHGAVVLDAPATRTPLLLDGKVVEASRKLTGKELDRGVALLLGGRVLLLLRSTEQAAPISVDGGLVGESTAIVRVRERIRQVADLEFPVLLRGESGTGKELVARAIHDGGPRRKKPYVQVNMGSIPGELAGAELFGAEKGAYTGAHKTRDGCFQQARGGTLFLDEIGNAPAKVQVALLRALETGEVRKVGAERSEKVDVRVIAATDRNLEGAVEDGDFRAPLLHRLGNYTIFLPPLGERREDFGRLFFHFLREELKSMDEESRLRDPGSDGRPWVPAAIVDRLLAYEWPGNVRQLRNVVRQLAVGSRGRDDMEWDPDVERLLSGKPPPRRSGSTPATPASRGDALPFRNPWDVDEVELLEALRAEKWNVTHAARRLRVSRTTLNKLMEDCPRVRKARDLSREELAAAIERFAGDLDAMAADLEVSRRGLVLRMKALGLR